MTKHEAIKFLHIETFNVFSRDFPKNIEVVHLVTYQDFDYHISHCIEVYSLTKMDKNKLKNSEFVNFCFMVEYDCEYFFHNTLEGVLKIRDAIVDIETKEFDSEELKQSFLK